VRITAGLQEPPASDCRPLCSDGGSVGPEAGSGGYGWLGLESFTNCSRQLRPSWRGL